MGARQLARITQHKAISSVIAALVALLLVACVGCDPAANKDRTSSPPATPVSGAEHLPSTSPSSSGASSTLVASPQSDPQNSSMLAGPGSPASTALAALPVKGRAPKTGYSRDQFGAAWADVDHNGCDTRNDILDRDLIGTTYKPGTKDCVVLTGTLNDPYTAKAIAFVRGETTSTAVQIDHVVALSDAWQKGAQQLSADQRMAFANDPLNLLAVDGPANQQKGDGDAATWLPANKTFRCDYVARQIAVKLTYGLWVTAGERDAMSAVLAGCAGQQLPGAHRPVVALAPVAPPAAATPTSATPKATVAATKSPAPKTTAPPAPKTTAPPAPKTTAPPGEVFYQNCDAVRAAGKDPIYRGQPGYRPALDRDGDGIGCEKK